MVMDVTVANIPVKFGMILSRSCTAKLKGTIQMDMSYATIPIFNQSRKLYRETRMACIVRSKDCPSNHPIYALDVNLGTSILRYDDDIETTQKKNLREIQNPENQQQIPKMEIISDPPKAEEERFWNLEFDGAGNKEGVGTGVWIIGPNHFSKPCL